MNLHLRLTSHREGCLTPHFVKAALKPLIVKAFLKPPIVKAGLKPLIAHQYAMHLCGMSWRELNARARHEFVLRACRDIIAQRGAAHGGHAHGGLIDGVHYMFGGRSFICVFVPRAPVPRQPLQTALLVYLMVVCSAAAWYWSCVQLRYRFGGGPC